jgi:hypothetical protein
MTRAHCMLDTKRYNYTFIILHTDWFSTATMVARTRLNVTLYVHCMSRLQMIKVAYIGNCHIHE